MTAQPENLCPKCGNETQAAYHTIGGTTLKTEICIHCRSEFLDGREFYKLVRGQSGAVALNTSLLAGA